MKASRILDEPMKKCVKRASVEIKMVLQKLHNELAVCNKYASGSIKPDSILKGFVTSAKGMARDARYVIHVCTGEEHEAFFKCVRDTLKQIKARKVEELKNKHEKEITPVELDQLLKCYTNSYVVAQSRLAEAEKRFRECINEAKKNRIEVEKQLVKEPIGERKLELPKEPLGGPPKTN